MELNKIYNEDCVTYMKSLPDNSIDLIIADPPYFRVLKQENWDKFKNFEEYMKWSESYLIECRTNPSSPICIDRVWDDTEFTFDLCKTIKDTDGGTEADVTTQKIAPGTKGSFSIEVTNASDVNAEYSLTLTETKATAVSSANNGSIITSS